MTKHDWAFLACKILALLLFAMAVPLLIHGTFRLVSLLVGAERIISPYEMIGTHVVFPLLLAAMAAAFWWLASPLARLMVPQASPDAASTPGASAALPRSDILAPALAVLGAYFLVKGFVSLANEALVAVWSIRGAYSTAAWHVGSLLSSVVLIGLGAWLMFGSRRLASFIAAVRSAAPGAPETQTPAQPVSPADLARRKRLAVAAILIIAVVLILLAVALGAWLPVRPMRPPF